MHTCPKCNKSQDDDQFKKRNGLQCKKCIYANHKRWRLANPQHHKNALAEYKRKHPDMINKIIKNWRTKNPEKVKKIQARWRQKQRDKKALAIQIKNGFICFDPGGQPVYEGDPMAEQYKTTLSMTPNPSISS